MLKQMVLLCGLFGSINANALNNVDIVDLYGLNKEASKRIVNKYGKDISQIALSLQNEYVKVPLDAKKMPIQMLNLKKKQQALIEKIKNENGFAYVQFDTVIYPQNDSVYTTIEIVDKDHPERLRFISPKSNLKKYEHKQDLIDAMINYNNVGTKLMVEHQTPAVDIPCPVFHCTSGFEHPKLKPYLAVFNEGAINQKSFIINTLKHDKDPERRAAAAFLTAHFKDPQEIISILGESVDDPNNGVRNNVMRTTAETIARSKLTEINAMPFINALDSPYTTDRNKALFVLEAAADGKHAKEVIRAKGGEKLLSLLELKQPNNHEPAYAILKKISGKNYSSTDYTAWRHWMSSMKALEVR
jgi:hypothetical protein